MTLTVCSSSPLYRGSDALDVTRLGIVDKKPDPHGVLFAPSWDILRPALRAREEADKLRRDADDLMIAPTGSERLALLAQAERIESEMWTWYEPSYTDEMRVSYRQNRRAWDAVLARTRVVLCCYCGKAVLPHCHRVILRAIFVKLGAEDGGEL